MYEPIVYVDKYLPEPVEGLKIWGGVEDKESM